MIEIKKKHELFEPLYFVTAAIATTESRPILQLAHVSNNKVITSTDGYRIHRTDVSKFDLSELSEGLYSIKRNTRRIILTKIVEDAIYPELKPIIEMPKTCVKDLVLREYQPNTINSTYLSGLLVDYSLSHTIDYNYLKDALLCAVSGIKTEFYHLIDDGEIVMFWIKSPLGEAFIRPIQLRREKKNDRT